MRSRAYLAFKVTIVRLLIASNVTAKPNNKSWIRPEESTKITYLTQFSRLSAGRLKMKTILFGILDDFKPSIKSAYTNKKTESLQRISYEAP